MEAAVERRTTEGSRVALDVSVELAHTGHDEKFVADAVNLGLGGLTMRAPYLPDIGQSLTCRFETRDGRTIEAGAEVAWSDPSAGQFGLHFVSVPMAAKKALRETVLGPISTPTTAATESVSVLRAAASSVANGAGGIAAVPVADLHRVPEVRLEGTDRPIQGRVLAQSSRGLTLEQELPQLKLDTGFVVDESGVTGKLRNVNLAFENGTPRLVLDLTYEDEADELRSSNDATIPDFLLCEGPRFLVEARDQIPTVDIRPPQETPRVTRDGEAAPSPLFREEEVADAIDIMLAEQAFDEATTFNRQAPAPEAPAEPEARSEDADMLDGAGTAYHESRPSRSEERGPRSRDESSEPTGAATSTRRLPTEFLPVAVKAFQEWGADFSKLRGLLGRGVPTAAALATMFRAVRAWFRYRVVPAFHAQTRGVRAACARGLSTIRTRVTQLRSEVEGFGFGRPAKRKTAPAPRGSNLGASALRRDGLGRRRSAAEPARRLKRGRWILAALLIGSGVAVGGQLLRGDAPGPESGPFIAPKPAFLASAKQQVPIPALEDRDPATRVPEASDAVSSDVAREVGPISEPSFPSLRGGPPPQAPEALPSGSPYAVDIGDSDRAAPDETPPPAEAADSLLFGEASVPGAESYVLRMSQPVTRLDGRTLENGFSVQIPGSLSLDRAGPLARSHPLVEHSTILNRGDHAELSVRFVEGRRPAYRVRGRGSSVEITVAQR